MCISAPVTFLLLLTHHPFPQSPLGFSSCAAITRTLFSGALAVPPLESYVGLCKQALLPARRATILRATE